MHIILLLMSLAGVAGEADAPKTARLLHVDRVLSMVPKNLRGSDNAAVGERFSEAKWNAWLSENLIGDKLTMGVNRIASTVQKNDKGQLFVLVSADVEAMPPALPQLGQTGRHRVVATCTFDDKHAGLLAKIKGGEHVVVTGTIEAIERSSRVLSNPDGGGREIITHQVLLGDCSLRLVPAPKGGK